MVARVGVSQEEAQLEAVPTAAPGGAPLAVQLPMVPAEAGTPGTASLGVWREVGGVGHVAQVQPEAA